MLSASRIALAAAALALAASSAGAQVIWTDWLGATSPSTVVGTLPVSGGGITVGYTGPYVGYQATPGTNYWAPSPGTPWAAYDTPGAPTNTDFIQLAPAGSHKLTFSAAVLNPYLAIISQGQPSYPVTYNFTGGAKFKVVDEGRGHWGDGWYQRDGDGINRNGAFSALSSSLTGFEFHGMLQFQGAFTELNWSSDPAEFWHGFTLGVDGRAPPAGVVPEPATISLLGLGLAGLAAVARRRRA